MVFFILTSLWWLAHELTGCMMITEILHWIISPFIYSCADHTGNPFPAVDVSQGLKWTSLGPVSGATKHISLQVQTWKLTLALASPCGPTVTRGEQISPGNPWALLIFRVNNVTVWARKLLLLTAAIVCGVRGHQSRVFLLTLCIEFKQEQHSCGNTLLQLRRTPREKVLSSSGVMANKIFFSFSVCLPQVWLHHVQPSVMLPIIILQCTIKTPTTFICVHLFLRRVVLFLLAEHMKSSQMAA